jgi:hypothetical protein
VVVFTKGVAMRFGLRTATAAAVLAGAALALAACLPVPPGGGGTTTTTNLPVTTTTVAHGGKIGPEQHFIGLVNGKSSDAVIYVVCPGPAGGNRTGPPAGNQTVDVHQVESGGGDTGSLGNHLWSQLDRFHIIASFDYYDSPAGLPNTLQLPCDGTGVVTFTSCFDTLPCGVDTVDYLVKVTFVNIAV